MKQFCDMVQMVFTALDGWLGCFLGGWDRLLYALIAFVMGDSITGMMCAMIDHKLANEIGFRGIFKKMLIFMLVGIGNILDVQVIGNGTGLRTAVILYYISHEGISLLENAGYLGLPFPAKLMAVLEQLRDRSEDGKDA